MSLIKKKHKKRPLINSMEHERQKQMLLMVQRYARQIKAADWLNQYSYNFAYVTADKPEDLQYREFTCNTNNLVFAAMLFEAWMLPTTIAIAYCEFNNLVK